MLIQDVPKRKFMQLIVNITKQIPNASERFQIQTSLEYFNQYQTQNTSF